MNTRRREERSDEELLQLARRRPESRAGKQAASELLERYQGRVYQWCRRYMRERERALDMAQEVLLTAYRKLDTFGERARFSSWLFTIARNHCVSELRRPSLLIDDEGDAERQAAAGTLPDEEFQDREEEQLVREMMRRHLVPVEQQALWLRCFERMPVDEITALLGIEAASGARGVLQSARRKMRAVFAKSDGAQGAL